MKLKHRSIRFKFFAAISIIALVFIGILVLLNVFFYQDYYMMTRRSELRDAYGSICTSYAIPRMLPRCWTAMRAAVPFVWRW